MMLFRDNVNIVVSIVVVDMEQNLNPRRIRIIRVTSVISP